MTRLTLPLALCLLSISAAPSTQEASPMFHPYAQGKLLLTPFATAPYPHPSRADGYQNKYGTFPASRHYSDSTVGIFVPPNFKPTETTDFVVHFHGWGNNVQNVIDGHKLAEQLTDASVNAILLVPQGPKNASDSGCGKLELDEGAFARFITEALSVLNQHHITPSTQPGHIVLSAHSGGYKVTAGILHHGGLTPNITDVLLLDASYGNLDRFATWATTSKNTRLVSFYTDHLKDENLQLQTLLTTAQVPWRTTPETEIANDPARGVLFTPTTKPHNDVSQFFNAVLKTSALSK